jgi:imidazolonepropionase-like amidohydrolase
MKKNRIVILLSALIVALLLPRFGGLCAPADVLVIKAAKVIPISQGDIDGGMILIENGKIKQVGKAIPVPPGATVISVENGWVFPGLVQPHSSLGMREESRPAAIDELSSPTTAALMIVDGINPFDKSLKQAAQAGITATMVTSGRGSVIAGQPAVVKTIGKTVNEMIVLSPAGVNFSLGEGPKTAFGGKGRLPSTRMGSAYVVRKALLDASEYLRKQKDYESKRAKNREEAAKTEDLQPPRRDLELEPLANLLDRKLTAFFECYRVDDIMTALRLIDEFNLKAVLIGGTEGFRVAGEIARRGIPVIVGPMGIGPKRVETEEVTLENAAMLAKAGVKVAIQGENSMGIGAPEELPLAAALAVKGGLSRAEALRAITLTAAEVIGVAHRIGSLDPGKDADIVIFDGDPLHYRTRVLRVLIDGKIVFGDGPR